MDEHAGNDLCFWHRFNEFKLYECPSLPAQLETLAIKRERTTTTVKFSTFHFIASKNILLYIQSINIYIITET